MPRLPHAQGGEILSVGVLTGQPTSAFMETEKMWHAGPLVLTELRDAGDRVFTCQRRAVRTKASGVPVEWVNYVVATFRNGEYVRAEVFLDRQKALEAVGLDVAGERGGRAGHA